MLTKADQGEEVWTYYTTRVAATDKSTKLVFQTDGWATIDDVRVERVPSDVMLEVQKLEKLTEGKMELILAVTPTKRGTSGGEGEFVIELSQSLDEWSL